MVNLIKVFFSIVFCAMTACNGMHSGYITFSPQTSAYSEMCPDVMNYNGRQPVSLNAVQFGVTGDKCGKCIRIKRSVPSNTIKSQAIVTNVLPQGMTGDLDAPIPGRTGVARISWDFEDCGISK